MNEQMKQGLAFLGITGATIWVLTRPKVSARFRQQTGTMTPTQLAEMYRDMVSSPLRVYINPTDENDPTTGTPWHIDLAQFTKNYQAVADMYKQYYGRNLTDDLRSWFSGIELSQYVNALWQTNQQAMTP